MKHQSAEQLLEAYYGDAGAEFETHLQTCQECRRSMEQLTATLDGLSEYEAPQRGETYGAEVWNRIAGQLPRAKPWFRFSRMRTLGPAIAVLLVMAFLGGVWTEQREARHRQTLAVAKTRERVLLMTLRDHLERSQIVLTELAHANPDSPELSDRRERARELADENRLLRQTAIHLGDRQHAALLDELERVLVDVANGPEALSAEELTELQERIERDRLVWKLRITSANAREKGQTL